MGFKSKVKNGIRSVIQMTKEEKICPIPQPVNVDKVLEGKVAMITGGSGGIGFAMTKAFLDAGCKVIMCGTNEHKLQECLEKIGGGGR